MHDPIVHLYSLNLYLVIDKLSETFFKSAELKITTNCSKGALHDNFKLCFYSLKLIKLQVRFDLRNDS